MPSADEPPGLAEALAWLQAAVEAEYGMTPARVRIEIAGGGEFRLPMPAYGLRRFRKEERPSASAPQPAPPPPPQPAAVEEDSGSQRRHSRCVDDILALLESKGFPLTTTRLMSELSRAGKEWSLRYVEKLLAEMVQDGTVENPPDAKPRGYRLPDATSSEEEEN